MKLITVIALMSCAICSAQKSSQDAAILTDSRYLSTSGKFGSSYTQEDGVEFKEEADVDGNRKGSYSYVDPLGLRRTVTYTAGVDGFRPSGDFLPVPIPPPITANVQQNQLSSIQDAVSSGYQINPASLRLIPSSLQVQYQNIKSHLLPNSIPSLKSLNSLPVVVSSTEYPSKVYPPGKLNVQQSQDGYSYVFNTIV